MNTFRRQLEHICQNVLLTIALFIPCLRIEFAWMEACGPTMGMKRDVAGFPEMETNFVW